MLPVLAISSHHSHTSKHDKSFQKQKETQCSQYFNLFNLYMLVVSVYNKRVLFRMFFFFGLFTIEFQNALLSLANSELPSLDFLCAYQEPLLLQK